MISGENAWVISLDNVSKLPPLVSDNICGLATGRGLATRRLYTNAGEKIFKGARPIILNGITQFATRSDLLDRAILITLQRIPPEKRRKEADVLRDCKLSASKILGVLLDATSYALKNPVTLHRRPRMADFAEWVAAAEPALGWKKGLRSESFTLMSDGKALRLPFLFGVGSGIIPGARLNLTGAFLMARCPSCAPAS
jgi:hypothetical protein